MPIADPQPGDLLITTNGQGGLFLYRVLMDGKHDWFASATVFLRQRGVSRYGMQGKPAGNYRPAPDFTVGRVFDKGQARHLIAKYFPQMAEGTPRILLFRSPFYYTDDEKPLLPERKPRAV
jgi:hypothetical protein